ncbi:MAG: Na+/H+ antiporter NhaA [Chloroflexi bacterium]|nr:Na+/H+ antiporter NhaA [Chloroflexota bacterium]
MLAPIRLLEPLRDFLRREAAGGILLMIAAAAALIVANSPLGDAWDAMWHTYLGVVVGDWSWSMSMVHWVNDGLMAIFFLVVGLEIKRELRMGELREPRTAMLPMAAAVGGAVVPALIYIVINIGGPGASGWGVPMATDIAFALGVLAIVGSRVPASLKLFLTTLAIVDDLLAVGVIALFYTGSIDLLGVTAAVVCLALLLTANRMGVRSLLVYGVFGVGLWVGVLVSGVHATIAGVLLAFTIPAVVGAMPIDGRPTRSPLIALEHLLHPWSAFLIVPIFALANAGVRLDGGLEVFSEPITLGIILGLVLGKPVGILASTWLLGRFTGVGLPEGTTQAQMLSVGLLAGIGFTMSLFIADLASFDEVGHRNAKLGILAASVIAGVGGFIAMRLSTRGERGTPGPLGSPESRSE